MMDNKEKQKLIDNVLSGKIHIRELNENCFHTPRRAEARAGHRDGYAHERSVHEDGNQRG